MPRTGKRDGDNVTLKADPEAPLEAQVFKTRIDPFVQKLSYIRVYSGTLKKDSTLPATGTRKGIKIGPLLSVQGDKTAPVDQALAGEIVAIAKSEDLHTGSIARRSDVAADRIPATNGRAGRFAENAWGRDEALRCTP